MIAVRFRAAGRVQGVGFRASTRRQAEELQLAGYVRNLDDGSVEVLAIGAEAAIVNLADWLQRGPRFARVDSLTREDLDPLPTTPPGFRIV